MALELYEADHENAFDDDEDTLVLRGVILDGVYRGERSYGEMVGAYGFENEQQIVQAIHNHYVMAKEADREAVESVWDDDWETELTQSDL